MWGLQGRGWPGAHTPSISGLPVQDAVDRLLDKLNLRVCQDVMIGSASVKGISGGQAKRTNIGIALITNPRVLFLDEPTSGLDSYTANEVMTVVKAFCKVGCSPAGA